MLREVHSRNMSKTVTWQLPEGSYGSLSYKQSKIQPLQRNLDPQHNSRILSIYYTLFLLVPLPFPLSFMSILFQPLSLSLVPIPFIKLSTRIGHRSLRKTLIVIGQKFNTSSTDYIISTFHLWFQLHLCLILAKCFI